MQMVDRVHQILSAKLKPETGRQIYYGEGVGYVKAL